MRTSVHRLGAFGPPTCGLRWTDSGDSVDRLSCFGPPTFTGRWTEVAEGVGGQSSTSVQTFLTPGAALSPRCGRPSRPAARLRCSNRHPSPRGSRFPDSFSSPCSLTSLECLRRGRTRRRPFGFGDRSAHRQSHIPLLIKSAICVPFVSHPAFRPCRACPSLLGKMRF